MSNDQHPTSDLLDQIKKLEAEVRRLREQTPQGPPAAPIGGPQTAEGLAENIVAALGKLVPGLGTLADAASRMPEFHKRLAAIDEEVKRKFREQPLGRAGLGLSSHAARRQMGIPPSVRQAGRSQRSCPPGESPGGGGGAHKYRRPQHAQPRKDNVRIRPEQPAQLPVDVFDEGRKLVVLAEAPALKLEDVNAFLDDSMLLISVTGRAPQRVELPCEVAGRPKVSLANGILRIQLKKAGVV